MRKSVTRGFVSIKTSSIEGNNKRKTPGAEYRREKGFRQPPPRAADATQPQRFESWARACDVSRKNTTSYLRLFLPLFTTRTEATRTGQRHRTTRATIIESSSVALRLGKSKVYIFDICVYYFLRWTPPNSVGGALKGLRRFATRTITITSNSSTRTSCSTSTSPSTGTCTSESSGTSIPIVSQRERGRNPLSTRQFANAKKAKRSASCALFDSKRAPEIAILHLRLSRPTPRNATLQNIRFNHH